MRRSRSLGHSMTGLDSERLAQASALGRGLISALPGAGLLIVDADLRIQTADGDAYPAVKRTGLIGRVVREVIPSRAWDALEPHYRAALAGEAQCFEYAAVSDATTHLIRMVPIDEKRRRGDRRHGPGRGRDGVDLSRYPARGQRADAALCARRARRGRGRHRPGGPAAAGQPGRARDPAAGARGGAVGFVVVGALQLAADASTAAP